LKIIKVNVKKLGEEKMPVGQKNDMNSTKNAPIPEAIKNPKKEDSKPCGQNKYKTETYDMVNEMLDKEPIISKEKILAFIKRRGYGREKAEEILSDMQYTEEISVKTFAGKTYVAKFGQPDKTIEQLIRNSIPVNDV
jgi:hypothetical protein